MTSPSLSLKVYRDLESLQELRPAWEDLLAHYPAASIFSTWEWLAPWWRAFGSHQRQWVIAFFDNSGELAALAPLSLDTRLIGKGLKFRVLRLMGDGSQDSDNLDLPVRPGFEDLFVQSLLDYLESEASKWHLCELNTLPSNSLAGRSLEQHLRQRGWTAFAYQRPCSAIALPETWETYLQQLSGKERGKIGRYTRLLEKNYTVRVHKCSQEGELRACLETLFDLHEKRWRLVGQTGSFQDPARRQFYNDLASLLLGRGWLEFWHLELNGNPAASQFGFRYGSVVFQLQEGFDPAYYRDAVGYVLRGYVLKELIAERVRCYDFMGGVDPSKTRWGAKTGTYHDLHFALPHSRGSVYLRLKHSAQENKQRLRETLSPRAWSILHSINLKLRGVKSPARGKANEGD
ncbi:MAG TPA: GNAT family N-acetyltransferase [Terriglobia bacterium]|nr:GNAT family N-acetyltransferase [Terriglobia bacterium]